MLQWPRQLHPLLPVPVRAWSHHLGREGGERGPGHPARRWLPEDTLHFSAIYRVYPQPLRTALASLELFREGVLCSEAVRAVVGSPSNGDGGVGRQLLGGSVPGLVSSWCYSFRRTPEDTIPPVPQPCPTRFSFSPRPSPSSEVPVPQSHRIPRQQQQSERWTRCPAASGAANSSPLLYHVENRAGHDFPPWHRQPWAQMGTGVSGTTAPPKRSFQPRQSSLDSPPLLAPIPQG